MRNDELTMEGKVALVTGSSRGIGKAIADLMVAKGAKVIYTGTKNSVHVDDAQKDYWQLDLSDDSSIGIVVEKIDKEPHIDILVNNAGINKIEDIEKIEKQDWDKILKVNLTGAMILTQAVARKMRKNKKGGKILNVSSIYGLISKAKRNAYSASKAGLIGLTKSTALDLGDDLILVNALCPGFTLTDMTRGILSEKEREDISKEVPLGRFAEESEIAKTAVFLCSDMNSYMTGQTIVVDGGVMAK